MNRFTTKWWGGSTTSNCCAALSRGHWAHTWRICVLMACTAYRAICYKTDDTAIMDNSSHHRLNITVDITVQYGCLGSDWMTQSSGMKLSVINRHWKLYCVIVWPMKHEDILINETQAWPLWNVIGTDKSSFQLVIWWFLARINCPYFFDGFCLWNCPEERLTSMRKVCCHKHCEIATMQVYF